MKVNILRSADLFVEQIRSRERTFDQIFGREGHRKKYPETLRAAVRRRLEQNGLNNNEPIIPFDTTIRSFQSPSTTHLSQEEAMPASQIHSKNGTVTGGKIVPGRHYNVTGGGKNLYCVELESSEKDWSLHTASYRTTYHFKDGMTRNDSTGLVFTEVQPPDKQVTIGKKIEFIPSDLGNLAKYYELINGQMYEVRQPAAGLNFSGIFDRAKSLVDSTDGFVSLDFTVDHIYSGNGKIIVRAVK